MLPEQPVASATCPDVIVLDLKNEGDDTSTIVSDSLLESSSDYCNIAYYDRQLNVRPTMLLENGLSIHGPMENPGNISVEHSSDVSFGNKNFFTGPVVINIAESDTLKANQKEEHSDSSYASEIGSDATFSISPLL